MRRTREPPRAPAREDPITAATSSRAIASVVAAWVVLAIALHLLTGASPSPAEALEADEATLQQGGELFQANCAACHGTRAEGGPGHDGLTDGPALAETDIAYTDMTLRTGRMPIEHEAAGVYLDDVDDEQREAIVAWLLERLEVPGEIPEVLRGDPARGQELYTRACVACHGAGGAGGISGAGVTVPAVAGLDPVATIEAARVGPFEMPAFGERVLDDQQISDIAAYLETADEAHGTLLGIHEIDETVGALFAAALALVTIVALLVTDRARRLSRLGGPTPAPGLPRDATLDDEVQP